MVNLFDYLPFPYGIVISIGAIIFATASMEGVAWFLHRYVMHQFGWYLHEDHHRYTKGRFQKNDIFALIFAILSMILIILGLRVYEILFWLGLGVSLYGLGYFVFHDVLFHKRIKNHYRPQKGYMKRIFDAHSYHHQTTNSKGSDGYSYGFLYASKKYSTLIKDLQTKKRVYNKI
jgi:beta-carotene 3-hydroxylase